MHILLAVLSAAAGLIWALYRLQNSGLDLNAFNPFYWLRRRRWQQQLSVKEIHRIEDPMEAAAFLVVAMAHLEGTVTRELKMTIISTFQEEFQISDKAAYDFYSASCHLFSKAGKMSDEVGKILAPSIDRYEQRHKDSLVKMLKTIATLESPTNEEQSLLIAAVEKELKGRASPNQTW